MFTIPYSGTVHWCPFCAGAGTVGGSSSYSRVVDPLTGEASVKTEYTPGTTCGTCNGSGRVRYIYQPVSRDTP